MTVFPSDPASTAAEVVREWAKEKRRGVIFDFNGTLCDDEPILLEIFTELFARHLLWYMPPNHYYQCLAGHSDREIIDMVMAEQAPGDVALAEELLRHRRQLYKKKVTERTPITDDAAALVTRLAREGIPMAIVTGAQREDVRCVLEANPVGRHIGLLVTEEDVVAGKPDPEGFLLGAEALGLQPREILVFEDSVPGITAAHAAGMHCVAVTSAQSSSELTTITTAVVSKLAPSILDA